ncbi:MAG TPA: class I SAM-dependent methyltransferase [Thermoanaerobaculales bacterium]|nr:class I SAM-dependent methyltransferase [Thermoanaerobaculales bacterium]
MTTPDLNPASVAESLEVDERLLPYMPYLLQDLWALGSAIDEIIALAGSLGLPPKSRALDLGCGKGAVAVRLASELRLEVVGIDAMASFLADAERKASEHRVSDLCDFRHLDALEFVSREHDFDLVILASVGGIFGSFADTAARLRSQVRPGGYMLIDDGYLKHGGRMSRRGYAHYRDHDETVAELTVFGDVLLREASTTDASSRINDEFQRLIEERGRELMAMHPELSMDIIAYLDGQAEECRVIMDQLEGAVWLLRKAQ